MTDFKEKHSLEQEVQEAEKRIRQVRSNYGNLYEMHTSRYIGNILPYLFFGLWDVLQFMFLGMAFFKLGILTGQAKTKVYWWLLIIGVSVGLPLPPQSSPERN